MHLCHVVQNTISLVTLEDRSYHTEEQNLFCNTELLFSAICTKSHIFSNTRRPFLPSAYDDIHLTRRLNISPLWLSRQSFLQLPGNVATMLQEYHHLYTRLIRLRPSDKRWRDFRCHLQNVCNVAKVTFFCKTLQHHKNVTKKANHSQPLTTSLLHGNDKPASSKW